MPLTPSWDEMNGATVTWVILVLTGGSSQSSLLADFANHDDL